MGLCGGCLGCDWGSCGGVLGGEASTVKGGINWFPHSHLRVSANYIHALDINTATQTTYKQGGNAVGAVTQGQAFNGAQLDMFETRVQVDW